MKPSEIFEGENSSLRKTFDSVQDGVAMSEPRTEESAHECNKNIESNMSPAHCRVCKKAMPPQNTKTVEEIVQEILNTPVNVRALPLGDMILHNGEILRDIPEFIDAITNALLASNQRVRLQTLQEVQGEIEKMGKLLEVAICPNQDCDNHGTIAVRVSDDEWEPEPCQWCHEKNSALSTIAAKLSALIEQEK